MMTPKSVIERLLARIPEIVDFSPYFPDTLIFLPREVNSKIVHQALVEKYKESGQVVYYNKSNICGSKFSTSILPLSEHYCRLRVFDTVYIPDHISISSQEISKYWQVIDIIHPRTMVNKYAKIYVY